jgi:hypothetical protein
VAKSGKKWEAVERSRLHGAVDVKHGNNLSFSAFVGKRGDLGQQIPSFRRATATRST